MPIDHKDFMHGAALVAIADDAGFTALNKASVKYGHYVVNHDRHIFIKYNDGSGPGTYFFTFGGDDKRRLLDAEGHGPVFAVFTCGDEVVTGLTLAELRTLVDLGTTAPETVRVVAEKRRQIRVYGPGGEAGPIPRNSFPERILS